MKNGSVRKKETMYSAIGKGVIIALVISIIGALAGALMLSKEILSEKTAGILTFAIWSIAAFCGAISSSRFTNTGSVLPILLTNLAYFFILTTIGILFFESNFGNIIGVILALIAGNVPAFFIIINRKPKKHKLVRYKV